MTIRKRLALNPAIITIELGGTLSPPSQKLDPKGKKHSDKVKFVAINPPQQYEILVTSALTPFAEGFGPFVTDTTSGETPVLHAKGKNRRDYSYDCRLTMAKKKPFIAAGGIIIDG